VVGLIPRLGAPSSNVVCVCNRAAVPSSPVGLTGDQRSVTKLPAAVRTVPAGTRVPAGVVSSVVALTSERRRDKRQ
jgi:hypothetical protein